MQAKKNHFILSIVKLSFYLQKLYETTFSLLHGVGVIRCLTFLQASFTVEGFSRFVMDPKHFDTRFLLMVVQETQMCVSEISKNVPV